jgi:hypothetical protein
MKRYFYISAFFLAFNSLLFGQGSSGVITISSGTGIDADSGGTVMLGPTSDPIDFGYYVAANASGNIIINTSGLLGMRMDDAAGSAGVDPGWTLLALTAGGQVSINCEGIALESLANSGDPAPISNFDPSASYQWQIINAPNNNLNINGVLTVDLSQFYNSYSGVFSTYATSSSLFLTYTPIPEPSIASLFAILFPSLLLLKHRLFHG